MENMIAIRRYTAGDPIHTVTVWAEEVEGRGPMLFLKTACRLVSVLNFDGNGGRIEIGANA